MKARVIIGISDNVRFAITDTTDIAKQSIENSIYEDAFNLSAIALINIATVMSSDLKQKNSKLTISLKADGLLGNAKVKVKNNGDIISNVLIDNDKLEKVRSTKSLDEFRKLFSIGQGKILLEKDMGMKTPYYTEIELDENNTLELEKVFQQYYDKSEQVKTLIQTGVKFDNNDKLIKSGAIFVQALPNADENKVKQIFDKFKIIYNISELLYHNLSLEKIAELIFEDIEKEKTYIEEWKILEQRTLLYRCDCSPEYFSSLIKMVYKQEEIDEIIEKEKYIETVCGFCNMAYRFDEVK